MPEEQPEPIVVRLERRSATEMIAEFLREIAALILVFAPLDRYISEGSSACEMVDRNAVNELLIAALRYSFRGYR